MVGIFSRFSTSGHRRSHSSLVERQVLPPDAERADPAVVAATSNGIDMAVEFKPVEHPIEPLHDDQPIKCPLPEPSILNDGSIWKERFSAGVQRRADFPVVKQGTNLGAGAAAGANAGLVPATRMLASMSAPENDIIQLLEECKAAGI